jgi:hypothetical protein
LSENVETSFEPELEASQNNVYIVWSSGGSSGIEPEIFYRKSSDSGTIFADVLFFFVLFSKACPISFLSNII